MRSSSSCPRACSSLIRYVTCVISLRILQDLNRGAAFPYHDFGAREEKSPSSSILDRVCLLHQVCKCMCKCWWLLLVVWQMCLKSPGHQDKTVDLMCILIQAVPTPTALERLSYRHKNACKEGDTFSSLYIDSVKRSCHPHI